MIPIAPDSKPIVCTSEEELLAQAYSILRQVKCFFSLLNPPPQMATDARTAARDFCLLYEQCLKIRRAQPKTSETAPTDSL